VAQCGLAVVLAVLGGMVPAFFSLAIPEWMFYMNRRAARVFVFRRRDRAPHGLSRVFIRWFQRCLSWHPRLFSTTRFTDNLKSSAGLGCLAIRRVSRCLLLRGRRSATTKVMSFGTE